MRKLFEPGYTLVLVAFIGFVIITGFVNIPLSIAGLLIVGLLYLTINRMNKRKRREIMRYLESISNRSEGGSAGNLLTLPIPVLVLSFDDKRILWGNDVFYNTSGVKPETFFRSSLDDIMPGFDLKWLGSGSAAPADVKLGSKQFSVCSSLVRQAERGTDLFVILYFIDVTERNELRTLLNDTNPVVCILMVDNYEELTNNLSDASRSSMLAAVEEKLSEWAAAAKGVFRRYERDKYIFVFEEQYLKKFIEDKFLILDTVREIVSENGINASLSIGMGKDGESMQEDLKNAQFAIDMALSRGGDQVVIRNRLDFNFYGGRTRTVEKRTRVKSRVMANALTEMIDDSSRVLIMGHTSPDLDALGSAVGVACICRKLGRACNIVLDTHSAKGVLPLYHNMMKLSEYKDIFITAEDALLAADVRTLLVVVDVNRPVVVESRPLLESCTRIAVIDHHRRASDYIEKVDLNFHEPYASSSSEMVTELISYIMEHQDILRTEAEALLSGITLDTKNFTMRTGVRTFEAAAWLRRAGADTIEVKKLFQDNLNDYIQRSEIVKNTKLFKGTIAISVCESTVDRTVAAQAADELLNIRDVSASFVIFPFEDIVYVSGRSLGQVNVQMVLEKMGGGGHATMAAVQIKGKSISEVYGELTSAIDQYTESLA